MVGNPCTRPTVCLEGWSSKDRGGKSKWLALARTLRVSPCDADVLKANTAVKRSNLVFIE